MGPQHRTMPPGPSRLDWGGGRGWGVWRAHAHFVAFSAKLKGDGERGEEAAVEGLTLRLSHDFLLERKLHVFTAEVSWEEKERK